MEKLHNRLNHQNLEYFMVLEGGGPFGIGYEAGFLDEFRERGADAKGIHALGTSAGSWVASMMATDKHFEDVAGKNQIKLGNQTEGYMRDYAEDIFGDARSAFVHATGSRLRVGRPELEIFHGDEHDLTDMVTISSSVPGLFAPAKYRGERYWDGAVAGLSAGYGHLAPKANTLLAISALSTYLKVPIPGPVQKVPGWVLEKKTRNELGQWKKRNPDSQVIFVKPNHEISAMVESIGDIFNFKIAERVYDKARAQAADLLDNEQSSPKLIRLQGQLRWLLQDLSHKEAV